MSQAESSLKPLSGAQLVIAALLLSMANSIAILDMTIANVSVLTISGSSAVTPTQGTWVITSYAVAEAITVPLTGWFTARFGLNAVRGGHGRIWVVFWPGVSYVVVTRFSGICACLTRHGGWPVNAPVSDIAPAYFS